MSILLDIKNAGQKKKWKEDLQKSKGQHEVEGLRIKSLEAVPEEVVDLICTWRANAQRVTLKNWLPNRVLFIFYYEHPDRVPQHMKLTVWTDGSGYRIGEAHTDVLPGNLFAAFMERCSDFEEVDP